MSAPVVAHMARCKNCGKTGLVLDGQNMHDALDCPCCPSSTHTHAGPDQMTVGDVCRNVDFFANAVVVPALGGES